ncbi:MAG: alpha/beta fold hydrolase [Candidatus Magasanikbacteria bacterium]|nr:alpha/beta fold hydrolase [Candidatus Magasanikbacteria bacterium]
MEKIFIKNRKDQKVCVVVDKNPNSKGLVFLMHGLGGFKEQPQIQTIAETFFAKGFTCILFDTTNTFGESDGKYEEATTTNYYQDLEDVIGWAKSQEWYKEPFILEGHSLGGLCVLLYAEENPNKVLALAPVSPVVSGPLSLEIKEKYDNEDLQEWKNSGWRISESGYKIGRAHV